MTDIRTAEHKLAWGENLSRLDGFYIPPATLRVVQDYLFSGYHVLLKGNPGCGKTEFGQVWAQAYGLPFYRVNCGAIRSPRDWFGRWEFREGKGTLFIPSHFIESLQQPGLIIFDEINRTAPENHNPLMNILDGIREIYVEELERVIRVHPRCLFMATCNSGRQHTGTFALDHALEDRFQTIRLELPPIEEITAILQNRYPISPEHARLLAKVTHTLDQLHSDEVISRSTGLRAALAASALLARGNPLETALKFAFVNRYSDEGGIDSEQTSVIQAIQEVTSSHVIHG